MKKEEGKIIKTKSRELTEKATFKPTPHMLVWLDIAIQLRSDSPLEIQEASKELGTPITRQSFFEWKKKEGFIDWYYSQWKARRNEWIGELDAIGMKFAKKGSVEHWKKMREAIGEDSGNFSEEATFTWKKK